MPIGGSDLNPYLAQAVMLAAGIKGIEDCDGTGPATTGDVSYEMPRPPTYTAQPCADATVLLRNFGVSARGLWGMSW